MKNPTRLSLTLLTVLFLFTLTWRGSAQPALQKDYSYVMEIPSIITMDSSPAHLYVLSDTEGMAVFRTNPDSLQWLYSSAGMERRGNTMTADIRFAYLFGLNQRLTVLEPTSVLGVYSSTLLPAKPLDAERMDSYLYVALGANGLGRLSLSTPASVDSTVTLVERGMLRDERIIDLETTVSQLFVLTDNRKLFLFNKSDDGVELAEELNLMRNLEHIYLIREELYGSDASGTIYEINNSGDMAQLGSIGESISKIEAWRDWLIIRGSSNRVWTSYQNRTPKLWKEDPDAGNFFTVTGDQLWFSEYNQISRIVTVVQTQPTVSQTTEPGGGELNLRPIQNVTVPYPRPALVPLELEGNYPLSNVQFAYQSNIQNARIRGNGFYWQPQANDVGTHHFKIIATSSDGQVDSTSFQVNIRSFNAPPRFSPIRPITIPVGEPFTLPVRATDPDGMNQDLIRYLGVDLPEGSRIDEDTGQFTWTPTGRQVGKNSFQVIATDQYGAASKVDITIQVIEATRAEELEN